MRITAITTAGGTYMGVGNCLAVDGGAPIDLLAHSRKNILIYFLQ